MATNYNGQNDQVRQNFMAQVVIKPSDPTFGTLFRLRATNVGLQLKQEITNPEVMDGLVDKSVYFIQPQIVEGDIAFPLIHEGTSLNTYLSSNKVACNQVSASMAASLWAIAVKRDINGRLLFDSDILVAYPDGTNYVYGGCVANTMNWKVTAQQGIEVTAGFIGGCNGKPLRSALTGAGGFGTSTPNFLSPARQVGWNDFVLAAYNDTVLKFAGNHVKEFSCELNNNVDRYYTFNGLLGPQDVAAKKREIKGTFKFMGLDQWLSTAGNAGFAFTNSSRFTSNEHIAFGYKIGVNNIYWATALHGVIFKIEEMTLSPNEAFESTVNYMAMGACDMDYEAASIGGNPAANTLPATFPGNSDPVYSTKTRTGFPTW